MRRLARTGIALLLLGASSLLGGCYYPGYYPGYYSGYPAAYPAYVSPAPVYGGVVIGGGYYGRRY